MKDLKNKVFEDWQNAFPQLSKYSQNKYYKILGSILIGIELIKLPRVEKYRPYFLIYPLWGNETGNDLKSCLSKPIIIKEFFNQKGVQFTIPYNNHEVLFPEVLKSVRKQLPFSINDKVSLKKVLTTFDEYSKKPPLSRAPNSYLQATLMRFKVEMILCSGNNKQAEDVLHQIKKRKWDVEHFALFGVNYANWIKDLEDIMLNKEKLLVQLNINKQDKKIKKLQESELI